MGRAPHRFPCIESTLKFSRLPSSARMVGRAIHSFPVGSTSPRCTLSGSRLGASRTREIGAGSKGSRENASNTRRQSLRSRKKYAEREWDMKATAVKLRSVIGELHGLCARWRRRVNGVELRRSGVGKLAAGRLHNRLFHFYHPHTRLSRMLQNPPRTKLPRTPQQRARETLTAWNGAENHSRALCEFSISRRFAPRLWLRMLPANASGPAETPLVPVQARSHHPAHRLFVFAAGLRLRLEPVSGVLLDSNPHQLAAGSHSGLVKELLNHGFHRAF
jgi:hypothetical protein